MKKKEPKSPIVLYSPAPLDDGGKKYNKLYYIAIAISILCGLMCGEVGYFLVALLFCVAMAYTIKTCIVDWKWKDLRKVRFAIDEKVEYDELIKRLIPLLIPLNMTVEKNSSGNPVITYKNIMFDINYNEDNSFCLWWRKSLLRALAPKGAISYYPSTVAGMGMIGYYIQQVCRRSNNVPVASTAVVTEAVQVDSGTKFCTECGSKCSSADAFCKNCGQKLL